MATIERVQVLMRDAIGRNVKADLDDLDMAAAAALDAIPDGWLKIRGEWVQVDELDDTHYLRRI